jgi:hypothetical protein
MGVTYCAKTFVATKSAFFMYVVVLHGINYGGDLGRE